MIRLGVRLALAGGKEAVIRLAVVAVAAALGVGLLLGVVAGTNAVNSQNARNAWLNSSTVPPSTADVGVWWYLRGDYFHGETIGRVDLAGTGSEAPVPPGIPRLPAVGEYYASPAMARLLDSVPATQLGNRYPGALVGVIREEALPSPDTLLVLVGRPADEIAAQPRARHIDRYLTDSPRDCTDCYVGIKSAGIKLILGVVAAGLLLPVLMFIGTATRLSAARREERFAAMRLIGALPKQISLVAAAEAAVGASTGTAVGFGLFYVFRTELSRIPFTGSSFYPSDLRLTILQILLVGLGIPTAAVVSARVALRRVRISPLGVTRRTTPPPPRPWRLVPLLAGVGELAYFVGRQPDTTDGQIWAYLSGFMVTMVGIVIAGPYLTMVGGRLLARYGRRGSMIIAGRRLADDPKAGFRGVSGLILALYVTTAATGVISTIVANRGVDSVAGGDWSLSQTYWEDDGPRPATAQVPAAVEAVPGVRGMLVVHPNPAWTPTQSYSVNSLPILQGVVGCAALAQVPGMGACPAGATAVAVEPDPTDDPPYRPQPPTWPAVDLTPQELDAMPVLSVVVRLDGTPAAVETTRTLLEQALPMGRFPVAQQEWANDSARTLVQWQQLANVVILVSLPIAGCSLAVSAIGGLSERRRPFGVLRLTGVRLAVLRQVIGWETAVPLLAVSMLAIALGFLTAQLFLVSQLDYTLVWPGTSYAAFVVLGVAAALAIIGATQPLLRRVTGPEAVRNE